MLQDPGLRAAFRSDPRETAGRLGLAAHDLDAFLDLNADQLDRQAFALVAKRWHEVVRLAPNTVGNLGDEGPQLFRFHAQSYWPDGHRRHLLDARRFLQFLLKNGVGSVDADEFDALRRMVAGRRGRVG